MGMAVTKKTGLQIAQEQKQENELRFTQHKFFTTETNQIDQSSHV